MKVYTILWVAIGWSLVAAAYVIVVPVYSSRRVTISTSAASATSETVGAKRLLQVDPRAAVVLAMPLLLSASPLVVRRRRARRSITFGDSPRLNTDRTGRVNIVKMMPSGEIVAIRNKTAEGEFSDLVPSGGNNYNRLWSERRIWGEPDTRGLIERLRSDLKAKRVRKRRSLKQG